MKTISVDVPDQYTITVGTNLFDRMTASSGHAFVVSQPGSKPHAEKIASILEEKKTNVTRFELPDGEKSKSLFCLSKMYEAAIEARLERSSTVYAVGGGCVGDCAGFFAATYLRGVSLVQVPTTLLAMVDSSIGGKVGINIASVKNMAGAFFQPRQVISDISTLEGLPEKQMQNGMAEVIKHGLILDADYFQFVEKNMSSIFSKDPDVLEKVVAQSVRIKAGVVSRDVKETGERKKLNYGHTLGHGIETHTGLAHGFAISVGMHAAGLLSVEKGLLEKTELNRQNRLLEAAGLPLYAKCDVDAVMDKVLNDKKRSQGKLRMALLEGIGHCRIADVTKKEARDALEQVQKC